MRLEQRVQTLEEAAAQRTKTAEAEQPTLVLTLEEMNAHFQVLQQRAAEGDPEARWRVERINFFIERAKERHRESQQTCKTA